MKKTLYSLIIALPMLFIACDNFDENEILVGVVGETSDTTPITKTESLQRVLLEDYTAWSCTNCPAGAAITSGLITKFSDTLIVMAFHATSLAKPANTNHNIDFRTPYGEKWTTEYGISGLPMGLVNRAKDGSSAVVQTADWENKVSERKNREHLIDINLGATVQSSQNRILVSCENVFLQDVSFPTLINIVVLESNIIGIQYNSNSAYGSVPKIENYQFNHVLRTNGRIDFALTQEPMSAGSTISKNYFINIDSNANPAWDLDNCKVVVFVTNANTKEVIQINEIEL